MSCRCHDPVTFGHQGRRCPKSLTFGLDDLDCYLRWQRDQSQCGAWYSEQARERQKADSLLGRIRCGVLRVFHSVFA